MFLLVSLGSLGCVLGYLAKRLWSGGKDPLILLGLGLVESHKPWGFWGVKPAVDQFRGMDTIGRRENSGNMSGAGLHG